MSDKKVTKLIGHTWFKKSQKVGKHQLNPLSAARMAILEERNNPIAVGVEDGEDKVDNWAIYEVMMVSSLEVNDLLGAIELSEQGWKLKVKRFALGVADDDLNAFWDIFQGELATINESKVEPVETAKKPGNRRKK